MKYSVVEIQEMRGLVERIWGEEKAGPWPCSNGMRTYNVPTNLHEIVEQRLRTYMANGTKVAELRDELVRLESAHSDGLL